MSGIGLMILGSKGGSPPYSGTLTVGFWTVGPPAGGNDFYGYGSAGSLSPTSWPFSGTSTITGIYYQITTSTVFLNVSTTFSNPLWVNLTIAGVNFARSAATFNGTTQWSWTGIGTNPFGTTVGATKSIAIV